jgi:type I restriction enzyme, S subunit
MKEGWAIKEWNDVLEIRSGRNQKEVLNPYGKYPILGSAGKVMGYADNYICDEGTTIVGRKGTIDNPLFIETKFWNVDTAFGLIAGESLDKRFLFYFCRSYDFKSLDKGTTLPSLVKKDLVQIQIPVPPLSEQKQIVALLDKAFAAIDQAKANLEQNIQNAKELFESYLQGVFVNNVSGSLSVPLDSICELIVDCEHKTAPKQDTGYPSIRTPNIGQGELILDNVNRVSEETYKKWTRRAIPKAGDLILAREAPAGNIAVIPENIEVCLGQRTVLIRPQKDKFIPKYLAFLILSKDVQEKLLSHSKGLTVGHINMKDIRAFKIYNLPPLNEQERVVTNVSSVLSESKNLEAKYQKKISDLAELKKSILQKAFAGELTNKEVVA